MIAFEELKEIHETNIMNNSLIGANGIGCKGDIKKLKCSACPIHSILIKNMNKSCYKIYKELEQENKENKIKRLKEILT
jgi:hypothetical protein